MVTDKMKASLKNHKTQMARITMITNKNSNKTVNNISKQMIKIKMKYWKKSLFNIHIGRMWIINRGCHWLDISSLKIFKIKYWHLRDKMSKYLLYVLELFMVVVRILFIHSLKLLGFSNLINCHISIRIMGIILCLRFIWKILLNLLSSYHKVHQSRVVHIYWLLIWQNKNHKKIW